MTGLLRSGDATEEGALTAAQQLDDLVPSTQHAEILAVSCRIALRTNASTARRTCVLRASRELATVYIWRCSWPCKSVAGAPRLRHRQGGDRRVRDCAA